jgi:threonine/homoserine/homoserine lactone efflux protein
MLHTLLTFIPVAALLSITPGAATALVVRNAAVIATSVAAFDAVKLVGAVVLVVIGLRSLLARRDPDTRVAVAGGSPWAASASARAALRARNAFVAGGWGRRVERLTGAVLIGLGIRLALERR